VPSTRGPRSVRLPRPPPRSSTAGTRAARGSRVRQWSGCSSRGRGSTKQSRVNWSWIRSGDTISVRSVLVFVCDMRYGDISYGCLKGDFSCSRGLRNNTFLLSYWIILGDFTWSDPAWLSYNVTNGNYTICISYVVLV
jgi:hypothetical protein